MIKLNLRSSLVGLSMLAIAVVPAMSFANENASADVSTNANMGVRVGELVKGLGHFSARAVQGTVSAVNGTLVTVTTGGNASASVQTNADTKFRMKDNGNASIADIAVGMRVVANGTWNSAHTVFTATKVAIMNKINPVKDWLANLTATHVVNGKVTVVSGSTLTVQGGNGTLYTVNAASAKIYARGFALVSVSDIKVGDRVQVLGTVSGASATAEIVQDLSLSK